MTPADKTALVKSAAAELGFDRVGVTTARTLQREAYYRDWLARGHAGSMDYLTRNVESRVDPSRLFAGARSIICTAINYRRTDSDPPESAPPAAETAPTGRIAQYARGEDYHVVVRDLLETLIHRLRQRLNEQFEARACVDTAPLIERELAAAAGVGWIGKNTLVMHETVGSYLFLGEIVTTLDLEPDAPAIDHCGTCTRCLEACPTDAFPAPYQMDASRCISYLTIEHRAPIAPALASKLGDWVYGCDICQDVCPHNSKSPPGTEPRLMANRLPARIELGPLIALRSGDYRRLTRGTAARRATRAMWQRNAAIAAENARHGEAGDAPETRTPT